MDRLWNRKAAAEIKSGIKTEIQPGTKVRPPVLRLLLTAWALLLALCCPAAASADSGPGVYDFYGLLSQRQREEVNEILEGIREEYRFDAAVLITEDIWEDDRKYAAEFMQEYDIGYGSEKNGMCLFHQPDSRTITVVFRGDAQNAFDTEVQDVILDDCVEKLRTNDYAGAYTAALEDLKKGLSRFSRGKDIRPMDLGGPGLASFFFICLGGSFAAMAVPVSGMLWHQRSRMRTLRPQSSADFYAPQEGVELQAERDIYVRTMTARTKIPRPSSGGKGGGGGSFSAGGESFSGSSRKY